jgi:hypothetical protein
MRTKQKRLEYCQDWNKQLNDDYSTLKTKRADALLFLNADPSIVAVLENRAKITTTDMQDAIDTAKPDILETLAGIDEPIKLDPNEAQYVESVKKLEVLGNVMVKRKNKWFRICSDFLDDSMGLQFGAIKYRWVTENRVTKKVYEDLSDIELQELLSNPVASIVDNIEDGVSRQTTIAYTVDDEYVRYDAVPAERIKFPLDTQDFSETPMVIEEVRLYEHEFIRDYGQKAFDAVNKIVDGLNCDKPDAELADRFQHVGGLNYVFDKGKGKYKAYECYFWEGTTPWVMTYAADEILVDEENKYGKPPYRGGSPFLVAHSLIGKGYYDCLREIQRERTYVKRQIFDVITQNNFRRSFVNLEATGLNVKDYENNSASNALVRFNGYFDSTVFQPEIKVPLSADVLNFWEMMALEKDAHIPTPRAYGGLEGGADEKTYRGKQLKVNQASKKLLMMLRAYMEEVFAPLFQDTLDCIAKFMKKKTVVRYLNEDYEISPENIICEYALVVNVGLGSHDKQDLIVKLQQLIGLALQQMPFGIITSQNLFYMNQELVKAMGFLNTMDFVTNPNVKEKVMQLVQMVTQFTQTVAQQVPGASQIVAPMAQLAQEVMASVGGQQEDKGGENAQGTQEGQNPAVIQEQPAQPFNVQTGVSGNGFFA